MWLLPVFHIVGRASVSLFFRVSRSGTPMPPAKGGVMFVANHPNALVDAAMVLYAAERPVRFLAKSTLFSHVVVGWLVRASGSIPVYRRQDDPGQMRRNVDAFGAAHQALASGSAVGVFPEGISHSEPSLAPLKTGAARIALGAAAVMGHSFPIIPLGLVFRSKMTFRSRAHVVVGKPLDWGDLAGRSADDAGAVRELTRRMDAGLRDVTINLERWEDAPLVQLAERIYAAEFGLSAEPGAEVARLRIVTEVLAALRHNGDWETLAADLQKHGRMLRWVRLTPSTLEMPTPAATALRWALRRLPVAMLGLSGVWLAGLLLFWVPFRVTGAIAARAKRESEDIVSTVKAIGGAVVYTIWIGILAAVVGLRWGAWWGFLALAALPILAIVALLVREQLLEAIGEARNFIRAVRGKGALAALRQQQNDLAQRLNTLLQNYRGGEPDSARPLGN